MCGVTGLRVDSATVKHLSLQPIEGCYYPQEIFSLCLDPACQMAYYSADYGYLVFQSHLGVALDHKDDAGEKYICYCHKISYAFLKDRVQNHGLVSFKGLFKATDKIIVEKCKRENPFNCCCIPDIQKKIEEYLLDMKET